MDRKAEFIQRSIINLTRVRSSWVVDRFQMYLSQIVDHNLKLEKTENTRSL